MKLKAGTAREIITPKLGGLLAGYGSPNPSASVHDDLTVTAVILESGETKIVLLSVSLCLISNDISIELRKKCGNAIGIPYSNVILSTTHTHTGPVLPGIGDDHVGEGGDNYCEDILFPKCVKAVEAAAKAIKPVKMGIAVTKTAIGINRRQLHPDDKVTLGNNPWGITDPEMTVIAFKDEENKPVVNIVHCTAHNTGNGILPVISRDWCGVMTDRLEIESGALTAFFNGCAGDVAPRMANGGSTGDIKLMMEAGAAAGMDAVRAYKDIREYHDTDMAVVADEIKIPYDPLKPLELAKEQYDAIKDSSERFDIPAKNLLKQVIELHEKGETDPVDFVMEQTLVRIGSVVIVPVPFEASAEISLRLRAYSKFGYTLAFGYTNGSNSYLPSQDQICRGGYEVERFYWARPRQLPVDTDTKLINANLKIMERFL